MYVHSRTSALFAASTLKHWSFEPDTPSTFSSPYPSPRSFGHTPENHVPTLILPPAATPPELPAPPAETEMVLVDEPLAEDVLVIVAVVDVEPDEDILIDH